MEWGEPSFDEWRNGYIAKCDAKILKDSIHIGSKNNSHSL